MNHGFHHLFGNLQENLYQLGKIEAEKFTRSFQSDYTPLFKHPVFTQFVSQYIKQNNQSLSSSYAKNIEAYAEGLGVDANEVWLVHSFSDFLNGIYKFKPSFLNLIPACSSVFYKEKNYKHLRILDALHLNQLAHEPKVYLFEEPGKLKYASVSYSGHALKYLSLINEKGLTLALHSKRSDYFDIKGQNINLILREIIGHAEDINDIRKILKDFHSMTLWGIYASDKKGDILSLDIKGQEVFVEKFSLQDAEQFYFNHLPIKQNEDQLQPYFFHDWCKARTKFWGEYSSNKKQWGLKDFLNLASASQYNSPFITCSSIGWVEFNPLNLSIKYGNFYNTEAYEIWPFEKMIKQNELKMNYQFDSHLLREAQFYYDRGIKDEAYHRIQISLEKDYNPSVYFFFLVWQYIDENEDKILQYLYQEFLNLEGKLPTHLNDHRLLFLLRIEKILNHPISNLKENLSHPSLMAIYNKELKLRPLALKLLKKLIFPRLECWDIIYSY